MKVQISYACDLEDTPKAISELLSNLMENHLPLVSIDVQDAVSYSNEKNVSNALEAIDEARIKLAKLDNRLMDCASILAGYAKANADLSLGEPQPPSPPDGFFDEEFVNENVVTGMTQEVGPEDVLGEEKND